MLTQAEINLAITNRVQVKGMLHDHTIDEEEYRQWVEQIWNSMSHAEIHGEADGGDVAVSEKDVEE